MIFPFFFLALSSLFVTDVSLLEYEVAWTHISHTLIICFSFVFKLSGLKEIVETSVIIH